MRVLVPAQDADVQAGEWRDQADMGPWVIQLARRGGQEIVHVHFLDANAMRAQAARLKAWVDHAYHLAAQKYPTHACSGCGEPVIDDRQPAPSPPRPQPACGACGMRLTGFEGEFPVDELEVEAPKTLGGRVQERLRAEGLDVPPASSGPKVGDPSRSGGAA